VRFWQEVDGLLLRQAAKHADAIRAAFIRSIDVDDIIQRWVEAHPAGGIVSAAEARAWAKQNIPVERKPLGDALDHVYADGWVMGQDVSTAAYAHAKLGLKKAAPSGKDMKAALNFDWNKWKPGNKPAALLVRPSGKFSQLLETGRAGIKGMNDTTLDRVGTLLADSLESGAAYTELARNLLKDQITNRVVQDAARASTIAVTEMSRALNTATVDNYNSFGVEKVEWLAIDTGVCEICPANEAQGPIPIGEMFESGDTEPPAHPNCRCTILPVVAEGAEMTDEQFAQAIIDGEAPALEAATGVEITPPLPTLDLPEVSAKDLINMSNDEATEMFKYVYENRTFGDGFTLKVREVFRIGSNSKTVEMDIVGKNGGLAGKVKRSFMEHNIDKRIEVHHDLMKLNEAQRGKGFSSDFSRFSEAWYKAAGGVSEITITAALEDGAYTWAKAGYDWSQKPDSLISRFKTLSEYLLDTGVKSGFTPEEAAEIASKVDALRIKMETGKYYTNSYPKPFQIANMEGPDITYNTLSGETETLPFGRWLLSNAYWNGIKKL